MEQRTLISNAADIFRNKYICFEGRAGRKEFWYFFLFNFIISLILGIVDAIIGMRILGGLYSLAVLLPCLSVGARRLHDRNLSGWLQLLYLLPCLGAIILLILYILPGDPEENRFGAPVQ